MKLSDYLAISAIILSIIGILFTYFNNKKLNEQQKLINDIIISTDKQVKDKQNKAYIMARSIRGVGTVVIEIFNSGNAIGTNIRIEFPYGASEGFISTGKNLLTYSQMNPKAQGTKLEYTLTNYQNPVIIKFIWDDAFSLNNSIEQVLTI